MPLEGKQTHVIIDHDNNHILAREEEKFPRGAIVFSNGDPVGIPIRDASVSRTLKDEPIYPPLR